EPKMPALCSAIIRVPVVVHRIGEDISRPIAKGRGPFPAIDVAESHERGIEWHHSRRHPILLNRNPVLHREPFVPRSWVHISCGIDDPVLYLVLKLRMCHSERKCEVDRFLLQLRFLFDIFDEFDLLLVLIDPDFTLDLWSVLSRRLELCAPAPRSSVNGNEMPILSRVRMQHRFGRN